MKTCRHCGISKPIETGFSKRNGTCKDCKIEWYRNDRKQNPEKYRKYEEKRRETYCSKIEKIEPVKPVEIILTGLQLKQKLLRGYYERRTEQDLCNGY